MNVDFDKRLELIFGLHYSIEKKYNINSGWIKENNQEYNKEFYELYRKSITPEFEKYIIKGGLGRAEESVNIALHLNQNYGFNDYNFINDPNVNLHELATHLKVFVNKSKFEEFFENHKSYYRDINAKYKAALILNGTPDQSLLKKQFGYYFGNITVKLFNFSTNSYALKIGNDVIYANSFQNNIKASNIKNENVRFSNDVVLHMYQKVIDLYVRELTSKYFNKIELNNLIEEANNNGLKINDTNTLVNNYVSKALSTIVLDTYYSPNQINNFINGFKSIGYNHISELIDILKENDGKLTFDIYYLNEIVPFFDDLEKELKKVHKL